MLDWCRRAWRRNRTTFYLAVLFYPTKQRRIRRELKAELDRYVPIGLVRGWNPQTTAAVIVAVFTANVARRDLDLLGRERCVEQMRLGPQSLIEEIQWLVDLRKGSIREVDVEPFVHRFNFMNGMLASWLVREKSIDIFVKSTFVQMAVQSVAGIDAQTMNETLEGLLLRIGESVAAPAIR